MGTIPQGNNNNGQICGNAATSFFYGDGVFNNFIVNTDGSAAFGINDDLQIVGAAPGGNGAQVSGFILSPPH